MRTTILLTNDSKLAVQLEIWLRQVAPEKMRTETYLSFESYVDMLERIGVAPAPPIGLFIVDADLMGARPLSWLEHLHEVTREKAPFLVGERPKLLVMAYEGGTLRLEIFQNEWVDDLIVKPLDKTLFQQKVEILINDAKHIIPRFLFRARTREIIEVGQQIQIDEISEFAVGIRCSVPLRTGSFATIHADLFGEKSDRRLIGRVYECVKHPVYEDQYLARLSLFGLKAGQLSSIRRYIRANQISMKSKVWRPPAFDTRKRTGGRNPRTATLASRFSDSSFSIEKEFPSLAPRIAILDMNQGAREEAKAILKSNFKDVSVKYFSSFERFAEAIKNLTEPQVKTSVREPESASLDDIISLLDEVLPNGKKLTLFLRGKTHELLRFEPVLRQNEEVFGRPASYWFEDPERFKYAIFHGDRNAFHEFLACVESGSAASTLFRIPLSKHRFAHFEAHGSLEKTGEADGIPTIQVDLTEVDEAEWREKTRRYNEIEGLQTKSDFRFDAFLIDGAFLGANPEKWLERFVGLLRSSLILKASDLLPKIIVMADPRERLRADDFCLEGVSDFMWKPLDRRLLLLKLRAAVSDLLLANELDPQPWIPVELPAILGHSVLMEELSEYGLVIRHSAPFEPGAFQQFFTEIFGDDVWILGRCHDSVKLDDSREYRSQFIFFGHSDELLKRIRRWIREDYVSRKDAVAW